jgi:L-cysteine S-thiosulfotransferase
MGNRLALSVATALVMALQTLGAHAVEDRVARGRELAHDFNKGNCLACHAAPKDSTAQTLANIAPPLVMMAERFPEREVLRRQIWDPRQRNPNTVMPPFGKHRILNAAEIELIIDYLYTL